MTTSGVDREAQRAADPSTPAGALMVLAGTRPDLRPIIADNPSCSDDLHRWIEQTPVDGNDQSQALSWAPSWPEDPFGSVAGDPLMGSPLDDSGIIPADAVPDDSALPSLNTPTVSPHPTKPRHTRPAVPARGYPTQTPAVPHAFQGQPVAAAQNRAPIPQAPIAHQPHQQIPQPPQQYPAQVPPRTRHTNKYTPLSQKKPASSQKSVGQLIIMIVIIVFWMLMR